VLARAQLQLYSEQKIVGNPDPRSIEVSFLKGEKVYGRMEYAIEQLALMMKEGDEDAINARPC
jgi:hypothetical protein